MTHQFEPATKLASSDGPRRAPAIVVVIIAALGILTDRVWSIPIDIWLGLAVLASVVWAGMSAIGCRLQFTSRTRDWSARFGVAALLIGWLALSGAWHHWKWSCRAADDISNSATDVPQLVLLTGKVIQTPWVIHHPEGERPSWQNPDQSILLLQCRSLASDNDPRLPISGVARVTVDGDASPIVLGDLLEITGELVRPTEPSNPGEFNQRAYLRAQGIYCVVRSNDVAGLRVIGRERTTWDCLLVARGDVRKRAEQLIANHLGPDTAPVAQAMLLGSRAQIDEETRRSFRESGMLHILAISGMNVGLLWSWLWTLSRWSGRSAQASTWIVLIALPLYAIVTDANPPIIRATVVAVVVAFGQLIGRTGSVGNSLALAGLAILAWNPSDLFNTGAQLSFLAVFAILHATNWLKLFYEQTATRTEDAPLDHPFWRRTAQRLFRAVIEANVVGLAVWLITSPLIASEFHLISPIGSLLTVLLALPVTIMFWIGYSFLLLGLISPMLFGWLGSVFDVWLRAFLWTVKAGARLELGHVYVPAPPGWWTIGFYLITLLPLVIVSRRSWGSSLSVRAGLAWMVLGLAWGIQRPPHPGVTCTFISVGHGLAVFVEFPNGRTLLYDAGGMVGGNSIARTISQAIWTTGRSKVDAVVVSHADGDHCNALPELSRIVSPRGLFVHQSFLDWQQPIVASAIETTAGNGAQVRLISEGQSLLIDPTVSIRVLHPPPGYHSPRDNPNSIVLCLEYAGRRIVLTGDLELEGLERLLTTTPVDADVLLSPHHGSLKANPPDLARWATPEYVIVSTPEPLTSDRLATRFGPETQILTTATYGAVVCQISPDGDLRLEPFKTKAVSKAGLSRAKIGQR